MSRGLRHPISTEIQRRDEQDLRMQGESIAQSVNHANFCISTYVVPRPSAVSAITTSQITDFDLLTNNIIQIIVFSLLIPATTTSSGLTLPRPAPVWAGLY